MRWSGMLLKTFFSLTGSNVVVIWKRADGFSHSFLIDGGRPLERERLFLRCRSATHRPGDQGWCQLRFAGFRDVAVGGWCAIRPLRGYRWVRTHQRRAAHGEDIASGIGPTRY